MTIKCWQLERILRELKLSKDIILPILNSTSEYAHLADGWFDPEYSKRIRIQDRQFLDYPISDEIALKLLNEATIPLYSEILDTKVIIRSHHRYEPGDQEISAVEAYKLIGGAGLEGVYEKGSYSVDKP